MGVGLWWGLLRAGPSTTWTKAFCWKFGRFFFLDVLASFVELFQCQKTFSKLWFGTGVFYSELSFFVKSGVDITRAVMVWICLYMIFGNESGSLCHPQNFQEDGHFHLPHLPNSSKNHLEISWDHTITSWCFQTFFVFGEMIQFDDPIFQVGWNRQPDKHQKGNLDIQDSGAKKEVTPKHTRNLCAKVGIKTIFHWTMDELQDSLCILMKGLQDSGVLLCQNDPKSPFFSHPR